MEEVAERSDDMQTIIATTLDTEKTSEDNTQAASVSKQQNGEEEPLANGDLHSAIKATDTEVKLKLAQEKVENLEKELLQATGSAHLHAKEKEEQIVLLEEKLSQVEKELSGARDNADVSTKELEEQVPLLKEMLSKAEREREDALTEQERLKTFELEVARLTSELIDAESKTMQLKEDARTIEGNLEEMTKDYLALREREEALQEQLATSELKTKEAEEKFTLQSELLHGEMESRALMDDELNDVRAKSHRLDANLALSTEKIVDLEGQLKFSMDKVEEYEKLLRQHQEHASNAFESAAKFENISAISESRVKEMELFVASLQEEIQILSEKISISEQTEEVLKETQSKLFIVEEELRNSREQTSEFEQKLRTAEGVIEEFKNSLNLHQEVETQMKEDISALEKIFATSEDTLRLKLDELNDLNNKLREAIEANELLEDNLKQGEIKSLELQGELQNATLRYTDLEATVATLSDKISQLEELNAHFQDEVKVSEDKINALTSS